MMGIKAKNGGIAGALSSIFNVDNRHFLSHKSVEINRFEYKAENGTRHFKGKE